MPFFRKKLKKHIQKERVRTFEIENLLGSDCKFENIYRTSKGLNDENFVILAEPFEQNENCYESSKTVVDIFPAFLPQLQTFVNPLVFIQRTLYVGATMLMNISMLNPQYDTRCRIAGFLTTKNNLYAFVVGNATIAIFDQELNTVKIGHNSDIFIKKHFEKKDNQTIEQMKNETQNWHLSSTIIDMPIDIIELPKLKESEILLLFNNNFFENISPQELTKIISTSNFDSNIAKSILKKSTVETKKNISIIVYR